MKTIAISIHGLIPRVLVSLAPILLSAAAPAGVVNAIYNSASDVPITADGYTATGNTVNFTLNFAPVTGTELMVVKNTALPFINGTFDNLTNGQPVSLWYGGTYYNFVANYFGGSGNDLVLVWASQRPWGWGSDYFSELGDGASWGIRLAPVPAVATGLLAGKTVLAITEGFVHSLALCSDGTLAAWGQNNMCVLGIDPYNTQCVTAVAVNTAPGVSALYGKRVVATATGGTHNLALCSDGTVAAWGDNSSGELGNNGLPGGCVPVAVNTNYGVSALYGKTVVSVAAGGSSPYGHSLALCSDGTAVAWGRNAFGELGNNNSQGVGSSLPVAVNTNAGVSALYGKTVVAIAAGMYHCLALCSDGTLTAWGDNMYGQVGDNSTNRLRLAPVAVNTDSGVSALYGKTVVAFAGGNYHSLALCSDGTVAAWGYGLYGQLGDGSHTHSRVPIAVSTSPGVSALAGKTVVAIGAGNYCSFALCSDGTLAAWGINEWGLLGDGTTNQHNVPVAVSTASLPPGARFTRVASASTDAMHSLALVAGPPTTPVTLNGPQALSDGSFGFGFTNTPGAFFSVLATTNPAAPMSGWTGSAGLTEISPGQYQYTDLQATTTNRLRFYRVHSP